VTALHALTFALALVALSGIGFAARATAAGDGQRFFSRMSVPVDLFFAMVIVAEGIPNFVLSPCWS
jgi:hypothetical protein